MTIFALPWQLNSRDLMAPKPKEKVCQPLSCMIRSLTTTPLSLKLFSRALILLQPSNYIGLLIVPLPNQAQSSWQDCSFHRYLHDQLPPHIKSLLRCHLYNED